MWRSRACLLAWLTASLSLLGSPPSVLSQELRWPYNLPPHVKYYPEDEFLVKRDDNIIQKLQQQPANVVRKMSADPGEKFYLHYWMFDSDGNNTDHDTWLNGTTLPSRFTAPLNIHAENGVDESARLFRRALRLPMPGYRDILGKRDFVCPSGTTSCASINRPNSCCPTDSTCQLIQDTGLGDVGCCEALQTCAGSLSQCPAGQTSCPNNPGGGCCLAGFACYQEGCVQTSTTVVYITPTQSSTSSTRTETDTVVVTPTPSSSSVESISTATATVIVTPITTSTTSPTPTTTTQLTTTSSLPNTLVCSSGFRSCPASLGGGCCPTDRACGSDVCPELTSSGTLGVPLRPTTDTNTITSSSSLATGLGCPTGFYACSAYNPGGCCQVGRDCAQTSCPAGSSTTVVETNGVTAVAPEGSALTGSCAAGWSTCAASVGGGCCPTGYACGTMACTATASGEQTAQVGKIAPNGGFKSFQPPALGMLYSCSLIGMMIMMGL